MPEDKKQFTLEELAQYDGTGGKPVYIAHQGKVVDVSGSKLWKTGKHMARHHAGADLTEEFANAPHGEEVFERYSQVGVLKGARPERAEREIPAVLGRLLKRFPMLRRHPHPMLVHFPIVFFTAAPVFTILYVLTGKIQFEDAALDCLGGGVIFTPLAILTGLYTWWLNYMNRPLKPVKIKLTLSPILLALAVIAFIWRLENPAILNQLSSGGWAYLLLILALPPLVIAIGWYGAQITFPIHEG